jgi:hypothetical protein
MIISVCSSPRSNQPNGLLYHPVAAAVGKSGSQRSQAAFARSRAKRPSSVGGHGADNKEAYCGSDTLLLYQAVQLIRSDTSMGYSLAEAARASGKSKSKLTIQRAIKGGKISASRNENGLYDIDPAELHRMFPVVSGDDPETGSMGHDDTSRCRNGPAPGVTGGVAVPQSDGVEQWGPSGSAPSISGGQPWSILPGLTCRWNRAVCA